MYLDLIEYQIKLLNLLVEHMGLADIVVKCLVKEYLLSRDITKDLKQK